MPVSPSGSASSVFDLGDNWQRACTVGLKLPV